MSYSSDVKEVMWLTEKFETPPMSAEAKQDAGFLLWRVQQGELVPMPESRPMPNIGARCHELRVPDREVIWRIIYRTDSDAIIVVHAFKKKTRQTPNSVISLSKNRLKSYDNAVKKAMKEQ